MFLAQIHTFAIVEGRRKYGTSDFWGSSLVIAPFIPNLFVENPRRRGNGSWSYRSNAWNDGIMGFEVINQKLSTSSPRTCVHHIVPSQDDPTDAQYVFERRKTQRAVVKFLACWPQYYPQLCMQRWLFLVSDWNPNWNASPCSWKRRITDFNIFPFNLFFYKDKYIPFTPSADLQPFCFLNKSLVSQT